jgi:hypothetical protein
LSEICSSVLEWLLPLVNQIASYLMQINVVAINNW